jgi:uncharacterized protein (UPF0335 family)
MLEASDGRSTDRVIFEEAVWPVFGSRSSIGDEGGGMNQQVKDLIQKLGEAIHESVSESDQISGVVREIREKGFDVMLMLEATIGLNQVEDDETVEDEAGESEVASGPFTWHDLTFLKSLRITTEEMQTGEGATGSGGEPDAPEGS